MVVALAFAISVPAPLIDYITTLTGVFWDWLESGVIVVMEVPSELVVLIVLVAIEDV